MSFGSMRKSPKNSFNFGQSCASLADFIKKNYKKHVPLHPLPMPKPRRALSTVAKFSSAPGGPWPKPTLEWKAEQKRIKAQYAKELKEWRAAKKSY